VYAAPMNLSAHWTCRPAAAIVDGVEIPRPTVRTCSAVSRRSVSVKVIAEDMGLEDPAASRPRVEDLPAQLAITCSPTASMVSTRRGLLDRPRPVDMLPNMPPNDEDGI